MVNSKEYSGFKNYIENLGFNKTISVLEDVPLSRKKESDAEQEAFQIKTFDAVEKEVVDIYHILLMLEVEKVSFLQRKQFL